MFVRFRSNWNLEEFRFSGRGENRSIRRKTSGARERTNKKLWRRTRDLKPGYIDGRRVLLPVTHPCSPIPLLFLIRLFHNSPHLTKQNKNETVLGAGVHSLPLLCAFSMSVHSTHMIRCEPRADLLNSNNSKRLRAISFFFLVGSRK